MGFYLDANSVVHGFLLKGGAFTTINYPGAIGTFPSGINDNDEVVGGYRNATGPEQPFRMVNGVLTTIAFSGAPFATPPGAFGVNNSGDIVGEYLSAADNAFHGYVFAGGNLTTVDPHGSISTLVHGINNSGEIVGNYDDGSGRHGFSASPAMLLDPVPDLLFGSAVSTDPQLLATKGRAVQGVAADGVSEVLIRIPAKNIGDQFTLTLFNDASPPAQTNLPNEDGALGKPGDTSFSQSQLSVTAVDTGSGPNGPNPSFAFAVYRAPLDFARPVSSSLYKVGTCGNIGGSDDNLACRSVSIQIQNPSGNITNIPVTIVRPPVILIHGLWGDPSDWNNFSPLFSNFATPDQRFFVDPVNYNTSPIATIVSSTPDYSSLPAGLGLAVLSNAKANALGFQYNAIGTLSQIDKRIAIFKNGSNPANVPVAAIQADLVAHSMGGDIARTLPLQLDFLSGPHLGQGNVHKIITIDTPHLGSPLATQLLLSQNSCVANLLASKGMTAFASVQIATSGTATLPIPGAVGDLVDSPQSFALQNIANPGQKSLPTALIAGTTNSINLAGLISNNLTLAIHAFCGSAASNPLATNLTPAGWDTVFNNQPNDAIVSLSSQLNNLGADPGSQFPGYIHSPGTEKLGFTGPSVLDSGAVPTQVILLLNTPVTASVFHPLNP